MRLNYVVSLPITTRPRDSSGKCGFSGNMFIEARQRESTEQFLRGTLVRHLAGDFGNGRSHFFPPISVTTDSGPT